jgi:hypothetical protein
MFANLLLNLGFAHLFGTLRSTSLFLSNLISTSKPSNLNSHPLVSLVDLHFLKL